MALSSKCETLTGCCCQGSADALITGQHLRSWCQDASNHQHSQTHHALNHPRSPSNTLGQPGGCRADYAIAVSFVLTKELGEWSPSFNGPTGQSSKPVAVTRTAVHLRDFLGQVREWLNNLTAPAAASNRTYNEGLAGPSRVLVVEDHRLKGAGNSPGPLRAGV